MEGGDGDGVMGDGYDMKEREIRKMETDLMDLLLRD